MNITKKVLLIVPYAFGYTNHIHRELSRRSQVKVETVYLDQPQFEYKNFFHKLKNAFYKTFFRINLKKKFADDRVLSRLKEIDRQNQVLIIRPDLLADRTLRKVKSFTDEFIAYYYDSTSRFPRKTKIIPLFDRIFSYDRSDVMNYGFEFITNYIFSEDTKADSTVQFYNISTYDYRINALEKIAAYLQKNSWTFNIEVYGRSNFETTNIKPLPEQKNIDEVANDLKCCKIIVEVQRVEQIGLSFRVFEALGYRKKLITTNRDIVTYDFYNPQNILVIDLENIQISENFVESPYVDVPEDILRKYRLTNWVDRVFNEG